MSTTLPYEELMEVCLHEARHSGYKYYASIAVTRVVVRQDGTGETWFKPMSHDELHNLYDRDRRVAMERTADYVAGALAGDGPGAPMSIEDEDSVHRYLARWETVSGRDGAAVLCLAEIRAQRWIMTHKAEIESFARQLNDARVLAGARLEARLAKTFQRRQPLERPAAMHSTTPAKRITEPASQTSAERQRAPGWYLWSEGMLAEFIVLTDGARWYGDGRRISPDGRQQYRPEWRGVYVRQDGSISNPRTWETEKRPLQPQPVPPDRKAADTPLSIWDFGPSTYGTAPAWNWRDVALMGAMRPAMRPQSQQSTPPQARSAVLGVRALRVSPSVRV